jgi:hypothetical protein
MPSFTKLLLVVANSVAVLLITSIFTIRAALENEIRHAQCDSDVASIPHI